MTWQLAIETSGRTGSLALLKQQRVDHEIDLVDDQPTTHSISIAMRELLDRIPHGQSLGLVSVSVGPGSFTGLRIGVTSAKTLCFALKTDLVAVDTLAILCDSQREPLLSEVPDGAGPSAMIAVATNAYRGQVFMRIEPLVASESIAVGESKIVDRSEWTDIANSENYFATGPMGEIWPCPKASSLGKLAWRMYVAGTRDDYWSLVPTYLRKSAAEEKADSNG